MFFFRETSFYLVTKASKEEIALGVFASIQVTIKGQVDSESGMILNLKDVDFALNSVKKNFPVMKSKSLAFAKLDQQLQRLFGQYYYQLEMSWGRHSIVKNKKSFYRTYKTDVWFQESDVLVRRQVQVQYKKQGLSLIKKIRDFQTSCHLKDFQILMKNSPSHVIQYRIGYPELKAERVFNIK